MIERRDHFVSGICCSKCTSHMWFTLIYYFFRLAKS